MVITKLKLIAYQFLNTHVVVYLINDFSDRIVFACQLASFPRNKLEDSLRTRDEV